MASASGGAGVWRITGEDRAKHDSQFYQLKPVNGFVTGEQAKNFFMQSGLPTPVLGQIWSLADFNNDGKMDRKEFSIAMYLIKKKLQGFELPKSLPASLKMDPSPVMGSFGTMQSGAMSMGPTPPMGATPPMAAPGMGTPPMNMGMPIMSMAPTSMTASSLAMPIMANGVTPAMGQTNFMGVPPPMGSPATMMDTKPRSGSFNTAMPGVGPSPAGTFAMPHQNKLKYTQVFNTNDRNKRGHLTGVEARALLVQLGLPQPILAQIWSLSDIDKDGKLTCDEFCIAMFLCDLTKTGVALPAVLPAELMPNKARSGSFGPAQPPPQVAAPQNDSFGDLLGGMGMAPPPIQPLATNGESKDEEDRLAAMVTFEDRRKENFAKGQAELDRRRQMLQDQMKRENEARLEKERQEQEKRERYRQEQERKRQMELERHMEKQRQMEREREEQRQKMLEQREAARRELERQRQVEWERQRKEQLLAEKGREYEQLGAVKSRASNLRCELESLQGKKSEIDQKIIKVRQGVTDFTTNIEAMRIIRDGKINDIDKIEKDIKNLSDRLLQVQTERESLDYRVQTTSQSNPLSEPHRTVLHAVELKKTAIQKLKKELQDIERDTESNLVEIDNSNAEMTEMNSKINSLQQDISSLQRQQNQKQAETSQVKRQLEEEAQNRKKQEKEKQEKLRKELEAQRLKEQEKKKKEETSQDSAWFAFGNDNKPATSANNDIWSSAFASVQSETSSTTDTWASAFSSQSQNAPAAAQSSSASKKGRNFKALYPFDARNPDELNLNPGDIVWIPDDQSGADDGWMSGEKNGKKGWFPKDYVEAHPESESSQAATDAFSDNTSTEQPANFGRFDGIDESPFESSSASPTPGQGQTAPDGLQAQVLYPWKAKKDNHLSFNKGDIINVKEQQELWWFGELSGQTGWFPKSYVKLVSGPATTNSSKQSSRSGTPQTNAFAATASSSSRSTPVVIEPKLEEVSEAFVAIFSYTSTEPGDLVFNQGDLIMVTKKDGDWWTGSLGDTTGIFPANYVKKSEQTGDTGFLNPANVLPPSSADGGLGILTASVPGTSTQALPTPKLDPFASPGFENSVTNLKNFDFEIKNESLDNIKNKSMGNPVAMETPFDNSPFGEQFSAPSGFAEDPFASDSPFGATQVAANTGGNRGGADLTPTAGSGGLSTSSLQTSMSSASQLSDTLPNPSVDAKSMLAAVSLASQNSVTESESFVELSQYFPSSPLSSTTENMPPQSKMPLAMGSSVAVVTTSSFENLPSKSSPIVTFDLESNATETTSSSQSTIISSSVNMDVNPFTNWNANSDNSHEKNYGMGDPFAAFTSNNNETDKSMKDNVQVRQSTLKTNENQNETVNKDKDPAHAESITNAESTVLANETPEYDDLFNNFAKPSTPSKQPAESKVGEESIYDNDSVIENQDYDDILNNFEFVQSLSKSSSTSKSEKIVVGKEPKDKVNSVDDNDGYDDLITNFDFVKKLSKPKPESKEIESTLPGDTAVNAHCSQNSLSSSNNISQNSAQSPSGAQAVIEEPEYDDLFDNFDLIKSMSKPSNETKAKASSESGTFITEATGTQGMDFISSIDNQSDEHIYEFVSPLPMPPSAESGYTSNKELVAQPPQPATPPVQQPQQSLSANAQPQQQSQQKTSTSSTLKKPEIASVIAAYSATGPEQLSLQPGQIIQVRKKSPSGWWEGELQARGQKRKIGWFPANYVKLLGSSARSTPDSSSQRNSPANTLSRSATPSIPPPQPQSIQTESKYVDQVIALYPYVPQHDDELTFHKDAVINVINKDDANWWKGEVNGVVGLFPANYVGPLTLSPPQENTWSSDPDVLAQTSAIESKRQNYIHELINTEETYMSDMSIVLDAFRKPMSEAKVMTEEELETVFVNWTELILCNTKLLKSVRVRKKMCGKGQVIQVIGDILCENLPHMTAYIRFCSCQLNAAALIQRKTENSPEFKEIQKKCVQDNRTKGMPLSSFLLKPMQRITKYPLMIQKILQYTPEGHPDHQNLQDALAKAEELCSQVNEGVRERENCDKLEWIQSRVQCDGLTEKLVFNSITNCLGPRKLLYTSTVYKAKSNKELVAFLFNDFLLLTVPLSSSASTFVFDPKTKSQFKMYKNPIFLNEIMVKKVGEEDGEPFIFQVSMVDNRTYNLKASNQTERDSWVRHTEAASRLYLDTEKKKKESAYSSVTRSHQVGRLLVIIMEGINLASTEDVRRITGVGRLLVVLLEGCDLIASDANGKSDPYCEVSMGVQEHKTKVINATLNPKWNTSMQFTIKDVEQDVLCITVFDRDLFSPNDFLGRTEVRVKDIMVESKQRKGPITKRLLLHEVSKGEVVVKLDLQLYDNT